MQRREIFFSGQVQGVGFRYTAEQTARQYQVSGYVENLPDGRVHLVAEGAASEIDAFVADLGRRLDQYIGDRSEDCRDATGKFADFRIRY